MKTRAFAILLAGFFIVAGASADTLKLRSGQTVEGTFMGATTSQVKFMGPDGQYKVYTVASVEGIAFAVPPPPPPTVPKAIPAQVNVLAGTAIYVRMV
ncbi:MAG TPA: hypothetical protein VMP68_04370, partial [Candidatus Eisenbacteria bacterium]|nr:hypothetical protein [Candidatus Eisenbacteria bacterium]